VSKVFAFAVVAALSGSILVAYPYQEIIVKHMQDTRDYCARSFFTSQGATERMVDDLQNDCIGSEATDKLWMPYLILFVLAIAVWILWVAPRLRPLPQLPWRKNISTSDNGKNGQEDLDRQENTPSNPEL
jgi:hypothetical protein